MKKILIDGIIGWTVDARDIRRALAEANGADVMVEIASPGGSVFDGIEMFNVLRAYEGSVNTHIVGLAASMASYIALAGDIRTAEPNATYMIHNAQSVIGGDHNDLRERALITEGLSDIFAREYAIKIGKTVDEIKALMDKGSYFFGEEILDAGFVDSIKATGSESKIFGNMQPGDKAAAVSMAKAAIEDCFARVKEMEESAGYINKIAAVLNTQNKLAPSENNGIEGSSGSTAENNIKPEEKMDLTEMMAKDAALKAEIEARDKENYERGASEGKAEMQARIDKTSPYMAGSGYPDAVGALALKVLKGESEPAALEGAVTVIDAQNEAKKAAEAKGEVPPDTPPAQVPTLSADGSVATEDDLAASIARSKKMAGMGGE